MTIDQDWSPGNPWAQRLPHSPVEQAPAQRYQHSPDGTGAVPPSKTIQFAAESSSQGQRLSRIRNQIWFSIYVMCLWRGFNRFNSDGGSPAGGTGGNTPASAVAFTFLKQLQTFYGSGDIPANVRPKVLVRWTHRCLLLASISGYKCTSAWSNCPQTH